MQTKMIALPADSVMFPGPQVHKWTGLTVGNKHSEKKSSIISEKALKMSNYDFNLNKSKNKQTKKHTFSHFTKKVQNIP